MPFPPFHRPSFVKNTPVLNALTPKGAREADAAIATSQPVRTGTPHRSPLGQYRARVSVLRDMARYHPLPTAPVVPAEPVPVQAPIADMAHIPDPAPPQVPPIMMLPAEALEVILGTTLGSDPSLEDLARLRSTSREFQERANDYMDRPEQRVHYLRTTRNGISDLARPGHLDDQEFQVQVTHLIAANVHIGVAMLDISPPGRRQVVLDSLARATHLRSVDIDAYGFPEHVPAILNATDAIAAGNPQLSYLRMDASRGNLNDAGAQLLAANTNLTHLSVRDNRIGPAGARALAASTTITHLDLSENAIGDEGAQALAENTTITQLHVSLCRIGAEGAQALSASTSITRLDLSANRIGDAGAQALAANTVITQLDVSSNNIGNAGAQAMASNNTVTQLNVTGNNIGAAGVQALAANTTLREVNVNLNPIGAAGARALAANTTLTPAGR